MGSKKEEERALNDGRQRDSEGRIIRQYPSPPRVFLYELKHTDFGPDMITVGTDWRGKIVQAPKGLKSYIGKHISKLIIRGGNDTAFFRPSHKDTPKVRWDNPEVKRRWRRKHLGKGGKLLVFP